MARKPAKPSGRRYSSVAEMPKEQKRIQGWLTTPRTKPYDSKGIKRVPCVRCAAPAEHQWQVCADKRHFRALCLACDIDLNALVLKWAGDPNWEPKVEAYARSHGQIYEG